MPKVRSERLNLTLLPGTAKLLRLLAAIEELGSPSELIERMVLDRAQRKLNTTLDQVKRFVDNLADQMGVNAEGYMKFDGTIESWPPRALDRARVCLLARSNELVAPEDLRELWNTADKIQGKTQSSNIWEDLGRPPMDVINRVRHLILEDTDGMKVWPISRENYLIKMQNVFLEKSEIEPEELIRVLSELFLNLYEREMRIAGHEQQQGPKGDKLKHAKAQQSAGHWAAMHRELLGCGIPLVEDDKFLFISYCPDCQKYQKVEKDGGICDRCLKKKAR